VESLRWILLGAGFIFVIIIYVLGRSRRQRQHSSVDELEDDLPAFCAQSLDDLDEGVGKVRVITGAGIGDEYRAEPALAEDDDTSIHSADSETADFHTDDTAENDVAADGTTNGTTNEAASESKSLSDIIVLYILPKGEQRLIGSQINSSAQAMGLSFGEMNIFHFKRDGRSVFSLANMLEPGSFDADTIHDLKTTGLTIFMQIKSHDPLDDLTEMLQRSYQLAGLLNARLCNHRRQPLTEQDAENYRAQVRAFISQ
jgi:cell division protein ZipA